MGNVWQMRMVETGHVDFSVIAELQKAVGVARYHEIADEVIFALTERISQFCKLAERNCTAGISEKGNEIKSIAAKIGMAGVIDVTQAAMNASTRGDITALSALSARLVRIAEGSLFLVVQVDVQAP